VVWEAGLAVVRAACRVQHAVRLWGPWVHGCTFQRLVHEHWDRLQGPVWHASAQHVGGLYIAVLGSRRASPNDLLLLTETSGSYLGPKTGYPGWSFIVVFLSPSRQMLGYYLKSDHVRFHLYPFQFIVPLCAVQSELLTASLNKPQIKSVLCLWLWIWDRAWFESRREPCVSWSRLWNVSPLYQQAAVALPRNRPRQTFPRIYRMWPSAFTIRH
jgi:hypothetical protein